MIEEQQQHPSLAQNEMFLMNQIVVVLSKYDWFGLAKVHYIDEPHAFIVDYKLLQHSPDNTHTISLRLLGGKS